MSTFYVSSQQRFTLSGTVAEASSNETMIGVTIAFPELKTGVTTNDYGFYSITLPEGEYNIQVSYLGFQDVIQKISLSENSKLNFLMDEEAEQLEEVIVTDKSKKLEIRKPQMSVNTM
ncbi:MAG: carboxypeptidase-like regulatory domain-containing protein, partial [Maribacter sp.]